MLFEFASLLVITGVILLIVGILITRQYTLRAKLLTAFLVIVLVSLGVLTYLDSRSMRESLTSSANRLLAATAAQYADRLDEFNRDNLQAVKTEASLPAIVQFLQYQGADPYNRTTILEILNALQSRHGRVLTSYAILDANGVNLIDTDGANMGKDESANSYFSSAIKSGKPYQSPVIFEPGDGPAIYYSSPVKTDAGRLLGVIRAKFDADVLKQVVASSRGRVGRGSFAIVLNEHKLRLVHGRRFDLQYTLAAPISQAELKSLQQQRLLPQTVSSGFYESDEWLRALDNAKDSQPVIEGRLHGLGTDTFSAAVASMETAPWKVLIAQNQEAFLAPVAKQTQTALMVAGAIVVLVVLIVFGATQLLLGPVRRLTGVVKNAGKKGRIHINAPVEAEDEIGSLAKAFNSMADNINHLIEDLEQEVEGHKLTADSLRKLSQAIEQSPVSVMITDLDGRIEYVNPEFCKRTGYSSEEVIGKNPRILKSDQTSPAHYSNMWQAISNGQSWTGELCNKKKNGELFWENVTISPVKNQQGESTHYLAIKEDISMRKDYEERLLYQASYDTLTDLPNRSLAYDRIQQAIATASREQKHLALLYLDFDHFKNINDTLGHGAGDAFLVKMAQRLRACTRDVDTVARLGGDEFLVMLTEIGDEAHEDANDYRRYIKQKAETLLKAISEPFVIENMEFTVTASIGVAIFPEDGDEPYRLLKNADTAMYRSKRKGRERVEIFTPEMSDTIIKRVELDNKLRHALEDGKLYLKYQALMDTRTRELVGAEALLRWKDDELGEVSPEVFVPLAEESGLIVDIGQWVMQQACADVTRWNTVVARDMFVAINLSSRQFRDKDIARQVADVLSQQQLQGEHLELEITERLLMKDVPEVISTLHQFKEMNIRLSIDDFGTGYSSLSYLKRFPFDVLKIDKSFVQDIGVDPDDESLCEAIIAMAHSLGLSVIAEGVETRQQFDFLSLRGAELIQGYIVGEPMQHDVFAQFISAAGRSAAVNE